MGRDATAAAVAASEAGHVRLVSLVYFDFESAPVYVNNSPMNIVYDGNTYLGAGALGKVSGVAEGSEQRAYTVQFSLSGVQAEDVSIVLNEQYQGRDCKMWFAFLDENFQVIPDPVLMFWGIIDTMDVAADTTAEITLSAQSRLIRWEQAPGHRYNGASQAAFFPDDKGFEFVEQTVGKELVWPN